MTVTTALGSGSVGAGAETPQVSIVPAIAETDRTHVKARVAQTAAKSFQKAGRQCLLAEALTVRGIALARLGKTEEAQFTLQRVIEVAQQVGVLRVWRA